MGRSCNRVSQLGAGTRLQPSTQRHCEQHLRASSPTSNTLACSPTLQAPRGGGWAAGRPPAQLSHACRFCPQRFSSPCYLARHERSHTGERPFPCRLCAMAFSRKDNLRVHERRYHSAGRATPGLRRRHHGPPQHTAAPFPDLEGCTTRA
ncbi:B-cell lymphoma/leukemia 11B-like isoform X3 [Haemaphysalis longicornis]